MSKITLLPHQVKVLKQTETQNKVAYYLDMGLGKTFVGSEKMLQLKKHGYKFDTKRIDTTNRFNEPTHYFEYRLVE